MSTLAERRRLRKKYQEAASTSKPGEGKRFAAVAASAAAGGAKNPEAVAAAVGRKKYGKEAFQKMAARARKHKTTKAGSSEISKSGKLSESKRTETVLGIQGLLKGSKRFDYPYES
jgi:hypothetical protein